MSPLSPPPRVGRLAPSPTGLMHLGNAWAFWLAWLDVRSVGGRLLLRLEDIDPLRSKPHYAQALRRDLAWLGLDWDLEAPPQSQRSAAYEEALAGLKRRGLIYECYCSRKELRSVAAAPHVDDSGAPYPGTCRELTEQRRAQLRASGRRPSLRLRCPLERSWPFRDRLWGLQERSLRECGGDFVLRRSDGVYAYQLAVVLDDLAAAVNSVVRGRDILVSTPRQLCLIELLGGQAPAYAHLPLVLDWEGERLAKRHDSLSLEALRQAGLRPQTLWGFLAWRAGLRDYFAPLEAGELAGRFALEELRPEDLRLPPEPVTYLLQLQREKRYG